jgi:hypothetical protein
MTDLRPHLPRDDAPAEELTHLSVRSFLLEMKHPVA